jgi:hypothetical protein
LEVNVLRAVTGRIESNGIVGIKQFSLEEVRTP